MKLTIQATELKAIIEQHIKETLGLTIEVNSEELTDVTVDIKPTQQVQDTETKKEDTKPKQAKTKVAKSIFTNEDKPKNKEDTKPVTEEELKAYFRGETSVIHEDNIEEEVVVENKNTTDDYSIFS